MAYAGPSRRQILFSAFAVPALVAGTPLFAQSGNAGGVPPSSFGSVSVDVTTLLDHGGGNSAREFSRVLLAEMRSTFADRLARTGPVLTARITNLFLASYSGPDGPFAFGNNDNIEGDGVVSAGGRVVSTTHILTELPPSYSGAYYTADIDAIRMRSIAHQFAYWLRREMSI